LNSEDNLLSDMKDALEKAKDKIKAMIEKGIDDPILPKFENKHDERRFWYVLIAIISLSAVLCIALILGLCCCCCKKAKDFDESDAETTIRSKKKSSKSNV